MAAHAALLSQQWSTANARPCQTPQPSAAAPLLRTQFQQDPPLCMSGSSHRRRHRCSRELALPCTAALKPFEAFQRADEDARKARDRRFKDKAPDMPVPGQFQQTLKTSFTVGGLGLHTAEYAHVRVRPAYAGEGRYFVRVPEGTNSGRFSTVDDSVEVSRDGPEVEEIDTEADDLQVQLFLQFLRVQETEGYEGTFEEFVGAELQRRLGSPLAAVLDEDTPPEEIQQRSDSEPYVAAILDNLEQGNALYTALYANGIRVQGVEHLLSALEMLGVDNARIEIEGGDEIPIVDGSALGWVIDVQSAGTRRAVKSGTRESMMSRRAPVVHDDFMVTGEDGAYISFVPGDIQLLTAGVDHTAAAPIIGRQYFSWGNDGAKEEDHYRWQFAGARNYAESPDALQQLRAQGFVKGGTSDCSVIGFGDRWYDAQIVRFPDDEPARHKLVDLTGDLALLARRGGGGVPNGHILAYKADHVLQAKFLRAFASRALYAETG